MATWKNTQGSKSPFWFFCKTAHMMEHGRLLYLSLKKIMLNIFKVIFNNQPEQLCEEQRQHLGHRKYSPPKILQNLNPFKMITIFFASP